MCYRDYKFYNISLRIAILLIELVATAKQQIEALGDIVQANATMLRGVRDAAAVGNNTRKLVVIDIYINMYERLLVVADAVLEGVLHKHYKQ